MMLRAAMMVLVTACGAREGAHAPAPAAAVATPSTPPTARDAIDALLRNANVPLTHASCKGVTGREGDDTLGDYVAHLLEQLAAAHAEGTPATLKVACDPGERVFRCRFEVDIKAEDPWRYGVHFDLAATGDVAPDSVECPGAA